MRQEMQRSDATFYLVMSVIATAIIFLGFAPSFYLKSVLHAPPPLSQLTTMHGVVFTAWVILFLVQSSLVSIDRLALHRQLGIIGAVLFGVMLSLGVSTAITAGRLGHIPPGAPAPLAFMALPLMGIATTATLVVLALLNRRRSDWHKRLMLAAFFTLTAPAVGRLAIPIGLANQGTWLAVLGVEALIVVAMIYDYAKRRYVHPAYRVALGLAIVLHIAVAWAFSSPAWLSLAHTITQT